MDFSEVKTHVENDLEAFSKMAEAKRKVLTAQTKVDEAGKQARIAEESLSDLESNEKQCQTQAELLSDHWIAACYFTRKAAGYCRYRGGF